MTINEALFHQQYLLTRGATKWLSHFDLFGDIRLESSRATNGWEVENYLDTEEKLLWREAQQVIKTAIRLGQKNQKQAQK